jgi:hypothetical protein
MDHEQVPDNLANVGFPWRWRLPADFKPGPAFIPRAEFVKVPKLLVPTCGAAAEEDETVLERNAGVRVSCFGGLSFYFVPLVEGN